MTLPTRDPKKRARQLREWRARSKPLERSGRLERRTELPAVNRERAKKLEARNYGPKAEWIRGLPCYATEWEPTEEMRCVAAHVVPRGMGGCGGSSEDLVPFHPRVEVDWHSLVEAKWLEKYGRSKQDCRDAAELYEAAWRERTNQRQGG